MAVNVFDLRRFCELEWPTFGVGWPDTGTLDMGPATGVRRVYYGHPGHPDQVSYINIWIDILVDKPSYLKACGCSQGKKEKQEKMKVFLARETEKGKGRATATSDKPPTLPSAPESPSPIPGRPGSPAR